MTAGCEEALRWACRFLPFSRFLNAEEILQDTLLSLVSELPPVTLVNLVTSFTGIPIRFIVFFPRPTQERYNVEWNHVSYPQAVVFFQVAETLVQAFPEEEESVRVPLREKYKSLMQRLRHCTVPGNHYLLMSPLVTFLPSRT